MPSATPLWGVRGDGASGVGDEPGPVGEEETDTGAASGRLLDSGAVSISSGPGTSSLTFAATSASVSLRAGCDEIGAGSDAAARSSSAPRADRMITGVRAAGPGAWRMRRQTSKPSRSGSMSSSIAAASRTAAAGDAPTPAGAGVDAGETSGTAGSPGSEIAAGRSERRTPDSLRGARAAAGDTLSLDAARGQRVE